MKTTLKIAGIEVNVTITKTTNFGILKETLRDTLTPIIGDQNWGRYVEIIRDTVLPQL